jgi:hypothetical protein
MGLAGYKLAVLEGGLGNEAALSLIRGGHHRPPHLVRLAQSVLW